MTGRFRLGGEKWLARLVWVLPLLFGFSWALDVETPTPGKRYFMRFGAAASLAEIYLNGAFADALAVSVASASPVQTADLRYEHLANPQGIDVVHPRLSWRMNDSVATRGQRQSAYQILVTSSPKLLAKDRGDLWDSGKVGSDQSVLVSYAGAALNSRQACWWKARIWDKDGRKSDWSAPAFWAMGLLHTNDWQAQWISTPKGTGNNTSEPWFRRTFTLAQPPVRAFAYVASIDATLEQPDWCQPNFDAAGWSPVKIFPPQPQTMSAEMIEPNRLLDELNPLAVTRATNGAVRIDFGRAFTGWLDIPLCGANGQKITLEYSEQESEDACTTSVTATSAAPTGVIARSRAAKCRKTPRSAWAAAAPVGAASVKT